MSPLLLATLFYTNVQVCNFWKFENGNYVCGTMPQTIQVVELKSLYEILKDHEQRLEKLEKPTK